MWKRPIIVGIVCIIVSVVFCRWWCPLRPPIKPPISPPVVQAVGECECPEHVEVWIVEGCSPVYAAGGPADPLAVDPGDVVIFTNKDTDEAEISFTSGTPFYTDFMRIAPGGQYVVKVRDDAGGTPPVTYEYTLECGGGTVGNPKVSVGGGSGGG